MKNTLLFLSTLIIFFATSCKNEKEKKETLNTQMYNVLGETSIIKWTAYKTTERVPVKGKFNTINITNNTPATTVKDALNDIHFSIPISSLFSNDEIRDNKLKEFFFGVMKNTEFISGSFNINEKGSFANINMNGITKTIPIDLTIENQKVTFTNTLNLNDWELTNAITSLNKACDVLHKGPDGISKTWDEVAIEGIIYLKANN